jgi:hypothetical protein
VSASKSAPSAVEPHRACASTAGPDRARRNARSSQPGHPEPPPTGRTDATICPGAEDAVVDALAAVGGRCRRHCGRGGGRARSRSTPRARARAPSRGDSIELEAKMRRGAIVRQQNAAPRDNFAPRSRRAIICRRAASRRPACRDAPCALASPALARAAFPPNQDAPPRLCAQRDRARARRSWRARARLARHRVVPRGASTACVCALGGAAVAPARPHASRNNEPPAPRVDRERLSAAPRRLGARG